MNPYPRHYSAAFAFSIIPYPLVQQIPLRFTCLLPMFWNWADSRAYHVPYDTDAPDCDATCRLARKFHADREKGVGEIV